ncbi:MAG: helix-turn-helix domain-containing protein [Agathobacter sp.]|nr:helix-turn-helix domain-containing protein [Agathobacter sp.]
MNDTTLSQNYYTIAHIVQFTGLTDRTIRSYITSGILAGEKINGTWQFTPEQVENFIRHPSVRPSIISKKNALIYDFLWDTKKTANEICIILDLPNKNEKEISEFFCNAISNGSFHNIQFSYDSLNELPRVIIKGDCEDVLTLVNRYNDLA